MVESDEEWQEVEDHRMKTIDKNETQNGNDDDHNSNSSSSNKTAAEK